MITKLVTIFISVVLLIAIAACDPSASITAETVVAQEGADQVTVHLISEIKSDTPTTKAGEVLAERIVQFETLPVELLQLPYTSDMEVLFEEMTFVQLLSEEYARIEAVCAGNGLNNIEPLSGEPMILIPNAGDLSVDGSNVAVKLEPEGKITFIPRVQGQRIRVPMDLGDRLTGWEVESLTLAEAMQLMAAEKLVWTAKWFGPYGNGHGLPGHIAECDPLYDLGDVTDDSLEPAPVSDEESLVSETEAPAPSLYTPDMEIFFEEMTLVRLLSEEYARIEAVCAGNGLNNIEPLSDEPMILIPNAGDLSVDGSNVAVKLEPDGEITFISRVPGQRIRVPMDLGDKLSGWEVESLTLDEAMQLMAAEKLLWTAKWFGPYGNGHGLPGHIAECDPLYKG